MWCRIRPLQQRQHWPLLSLTRSWARRSSTQRRWRLLGRTTELRPGTSRSPGTRGRLHRDTERVEPGPGQLRLLLSRGGHRLGDGNLPNGDNAYQGSTSSFSGASISEDPTISSIGANQTTSAVGKSVTYTATWRPALRDPEPPPVRWTWEQWRDDLLGTLDEASSDRRVVRPAIRAWAPIP